LALVACAGSAHAQNLTLSTTRVATGMARPLYVTAPVGDNSRLFIVEQRTGSVAPATGRIRILNLPANTLNATAYLSIGNLSAGSEQGLLGLAFHPDFLNNGYFWVNYTIPAQSGISAGSTRIVRYRANAPFATSTTADPASATTVLEIRQPEANHNGGWIDFGPDGNHRHGRRRLRQRPGQCGLRHGLRPRNRRQRPVPRRGQPAGQDAPHRRRRPQQRAGRQR
jgi:glucose/arabinose dehydrogenase